MHKSHSLDSRRFCFVTVAIILCLPKDGNDFKEPYQEMEFFIPQIIMIKLEVSEPIIVFNPSFDDCWELIHNSFLEIIQNAKGIPKV